MAYGIAQAVGNSDDSGLSGPAAVQEEGTIWAVPIYSCATATKASIKTVTFSLNGTSLDDVSIVAADDKAYGSGDQPWWGAESTNQPLESSSPLWGMVDPDIPSPVNISKVQKETFYLPGLVTNDTFGLHAVENMPGIDFNTPALISIGAIGDPDQLTNYIYSYTMLDYSGTQSAAMFRKWQNLSSTAEGMAQ